MKFNKLIDKLSPLEKLDLIRQLQSSLSPNPLSVRQSINENPSGCPRCGYHGYVKFGSYNGKRRFRCKSCDKTFTDTTGTSIFSIKKVDKWGRFIDLMLQDKTIRQISKELGLSTKTVFEWRHKVLLSFQDIFTKKFKGIVEMDDIYFEFNQKGRKSNYIKQERRKRGVSNQKVSVMVSSDRYRTIDMKLVSLGRLTKENLDRVMDVDRLNSDNIIVSDTHRSISCFVRGLGLQHEKIVSSRKEYVRDGIYHVQNVNNITSDFRRWVKGNFVNVSTKYLQNYLFYYKMKEVVKGSENTSEEFLKFSLKDEETFERFRGMEERYQDFIEN